MIKLENRTLKVLSLTFLHSKNLVEMREIFFKTPNLNFQTETKITRSEIKNPLDMPSVILDMEELGELKNT